MSCFILSTLNWTPWTAKSLQLDIMLRHLESSAIKYVFDDCDSGILWPTTYEEKPDGVCDLNAEKQIDKSSTKELQQGATFDGISEQMSNDFLLRKCQKSSRDVADLVSVHKDCATLIILQAPIQL